MAKIGKHNISWFWGDIIICKNKSFEYQFEFGKNSNFHPFEFSLLLTSRTDHAGPSFTFGIKKLFWICLKIYDHRHWDIDNDCWE